MKRILVSTVFVLALCGCVSLLGLAFFAFYPTPVKGKRAQVELTRAGLLADVRAGDTPAELYLNLMKRTLTRYQTAPVDYEKVTYRPQTSARALVWGTVGKLLMHQNLALVFLFPTSPTGYLEGDGSARGMADAETMTGLKRLDALQTMIADVLRNKVPGDFIEAGAWRGGSCIFMRAALKAYGDQERTVWVADSFAGLPKPNSPFDEWIFREGDMAVSLEEARFNFARYGLLDSQVRFLKGFFAATLPGAPITRLAILRVDGDLYESTMDALKNLYPKLSPGGYVLLDDHFSLASARKAAEDYRAANGITEELKRIDWTGAYWQKQR